MVDEGAGRAVHALRARRANVAGLDARGAAIAEACSRRSATSTGSNIAIRRGACIAARGSLDGQAAGLHLHRRPCRRCPIAAWLAELFMMREVQRASPRAACSPDATLEGVDQGALVCSCFGVGRNPIAACARELGGAPPPWKSASASSAAPTAVPASRKSRPSSARSRRSRPEHGHLVVFAASPFRGDIVRLPILLSMLVFTAAATSRSRK